MSVALRLIIIGLLTFSSAGSFTVRGRNLYSGNTPTAVADAYTTDEDTPLTVPAHGDPYSGVLANDIDNETDPLTAAAGAGPAHGQLTLDPAGSFTYTPDPDWNGTDSFTYRADDGTGLSDLVTVTLTVTPINDAPAAEDDSYTATEDVSRMIAAPGVLGNDTDVDGPPLSAYLDIPPLHGEVSLNENGGFVYTPELNYNGPVTFTYHASDGFSDSPSATVTLNLAAVNDAPEAVDDNYTVAEDNPLNVALPGVLGNDDDPESGASLTAHLAGEPSHGTLVLNSNGSFDYTPDDQFFGTDSFTYTASDGVLDSAPATVTIQVTSVNDIPVATADTYAATEDVPLTIPEPGLLGNDQDVENDPLTAAVATQPNHGTVVVYGNGSFTYTPEKDYNGPATFTYTANDGGGIPSNPATVTLNLAPVNDLPVPVNDSYTTAEEAVLSQAAPGVIGNDQDVDNPRSELTATLVTHTSHGLLIFNSDGSFVYTPTENYNGPDYFTYYLSDQEGRSTGEATVSLTVTPVNDRPVAVDDAYSTAEDIQLSITVASAGVLANDSDVDGDTLRTILVSNPMHGILTLNQNGTFLYTPGSNYNGTDSFTYRANDGSLSSDRLATVTVTITPVNDAPVAYSASSSTAEDTAASITLSASDVDLDTLGYSIFSYPTNGTLTGTPPDVTYTPNSNYYGTDSFVFQVSDGVLTASATINLTVTPVNDPPVGVNDSYSMNEDTVLSVTGQQSVLSNDSDVDSSSLSVSPYIGPSHGSLLLNANGLFTYTPVLNYNGLDSFSYRVSDGAASSGVVVVTLTIVAVNDMPVVQGESYTTSEDVPLVIGAPGLLQNDSDVDTGDTLSVVVVNQPVNGKLISTGNGGFTYTPAANYYGGDTFTYQVFDGTATTTSVTTTVNITSVNDAPEPEPDEFTIGREGVLYISAPGILQNDLDVEEDEIQVKQIISQPAEGNLQWDQNGSFIYHTNPGSFGTVTFTYIPTDGKNDGQPATVTINLTPQSSAKTIWTAPVSTGSRYKLGPETVTLTTSLHYQDGFPCATQDIHCEPGLTYSVESILVRYYRYDVINGVVTPVEIGDTHAAPFSIDFDASNLRTGRMHEVDAAATITIIARNSNGQPVGSPILLTSTKQIIYLSRMLFPTKNNLFIPVSQKMSLARELTEKELSARRLPPGETP